MEKKKVNQEKIRINKLFLILAFFLFVILIVRLVYLCLADYRVGDSTITAFIHNRNVEEEILIPNRGTIYDKNANPLAQDVASYTIIAYLDESRSKNSTSLQHVKDVESTAKALAPLLNTEEEELVRLLSKDAYQVELGSGGRNLSQLQMEAIAKLKLPGIDFIKSSKRYYQNGDFASYILGYTVEETDENDNKWIVGELGVEEYFNEDLTGSIGYVTYEKDRYGYKIANGREYVEDAQNGNDLYLTIDSNIQLFVEDAVKKAYEEAEPKWALMVVADAKTGAILGYTSSPSFNPNEKNIVSYLDPMVNTAYEPGSTMKIFSYMCAIETGKYDGNATYMSGNKVFESELEDDTITINDWNKKGWGEITYDQGFALSSNIAVANLLENVMSKKDLHACYSKYGFGNVTGFTLSRELKGSIDFTYDVEAATAAYGQGITATPMQLVQALTAIANDGEMLKPYIVDKMVDPNTEEVVFEGKREVISNIASSSTIDKIKELMASVINPNSEVATGSLYYMKDYPMMGKTGTSQIFDYQTGKYLTGEADYIYSFAGLYPKEDPDIIIYMALQQPKDETNYIAPRIKDVVVNISKYLNIQIEEKIDTSFKVESYKNKKTEDIIKDLDKNKLKVITLGNGDKIIDQYPKKDTIIYQNDLIVLLTNNYQKQAIDFTNLSYKETLNILKLMKVDYNLEGKGYVISQDILPEDKIPDGTKINITLKEKYLE